jgi:hypothetical protein
MSKQPAYVIAARNAAYEVDLWAAAWGLSDSEIEPALAIPPGALATWRISEPIAWDDEQQQRNLAQLRRLQCALWCWIRHDRWKGIWRRPWMGGRSPVEVVAAEGPAGIMRLAEFFEAEALS